MGRSVSLTPLVLLLCLLPLFCAKGNSQLSANNSFSLAPAELYKVGSDLLPRVAEDFVIVYSEEEYAFEPGGGATWTRYTVSKVVTQSGAEKWSDIGIAWEPWHQKRPTVKLRVVTPDLVEHILDPKTFVDGSVSNTSEKVFSDRRLLRAPLPAIAPGAVLEEEFTVTETSPVFGAGTTGRFYFGQTVPVMHTRLVLDAPTSLALQYRFQALPDLKPQRTEKDGRVHVVFEAGPLDALGPAPDYLPSDAPDYPGVTFSTGESWQRIAEEYGRIVDEDITGTDMRALLDQFLAGKSGREDRIDAIVQIVNRKVRYTGIEFGDAAVVPHTPAETWKRKYGDCKDKSVLLISLLRAADIPAYIALLNAGFGPDVPPDLPGIGLFNHAIVYVPGNPEIWIDATDRYSRSGQLSPADQGRLALIARPGENVLRKTPVSPSTENLFLQTREFYLAEIGPARVVETAEPHGSWESYYRQWYAEEDGKQIKDQLAAYFKSQYLAEMLDRFEHSDPADTSIQFRRTAETKHAKRGMTDLDTGVALIPLQPLFSRLPTELQSCQTGQKDGSPTAQSEKHRAEDYELTQAFAEEWRYKVVPPNGFRAEPLPKNQRLSLGPATFSQQFSIDEDGTVRAVIRFDTNKRRFSVGEASDMCHQIADLTGREPPAIYFVPVAKALFGEGKIPEAFAAYRALIDLHPQEAVHHLRMAKALLEGGMGQAARDEAALAVKLEPASALAQQTLAGILEYDLVGRKFRPGSDYSGAQAAFRAAKKLAPDDKTITGNLAILLEYNTQGERYGPGAQIKDATSEYMSLTPDELAEISLQNNPAYALVHSGEFEAAIKYSETLNPQPSDVVVAAITALHGSDAGFKEARKRARGDSELNDILRNAGLILLRVHKYPLAADLFQISASGENASYTVSFAAMLRKTRPREELDFPDSPAGVVEKALLLLLQPGATLDQVGRLSSRNARAVLDATDPEEIERFLSVGRTLRYMMARVGLPPDSMMDLIVTFLDPEVEGTDATGYRVTLRLPNAKDIVMFVVREDGHFKLLDTSDLPSAVALEILDRLSTDDSTSARQILDWLRDSHHLASGDDPFEGEAFPRFWTQAHDADVTQMKLAAASLLVQSKPSVKKGITILEAVRSAALNETERTNVDLALVRGYVVIADYEKAVVITARLARQHPESRSLFMLHVLTLRDLSRWNEIDNIAQQRLAQKPNDPYALRALVISAEGRGDFILAHDRGSKLVAAGKAEETDLNNLAWDSLFTGAVNEEDVETALRAAQLSQNSPSVLHTLACVYAEMGKTQEARKLLLQSMDDLGLEGPNSDYWYAFGRIAEQYGLPEVARSMYLRVTKPKDAHGLPNSSYRLAQLRLGTLAVAASNSPPSK